MNVGLIFAKACGSVKTIAESGLLLARKKAPELLITTGLIGWVAAVVETVSATNKTNEILEHKDNRMVRIEDERRLNAENYTENDYSTDLSAVNKQTRKDLIKTWVPVITTAAASTVMILHGYKVLNGRYVATAAAYKTLEAGFERYRRNVTEEFGKDVDWRMAHSLKAEELEEERRKQKEAREKNDKKGRKVPRTQYSKEINNQIFDIHSSDYWKKFWIPSQVIDFVRMVESRLQDKVNIDGFAFLNDAYDMLGMPKTSQGAVVGWINTPRNKHNEKGSFVSLGFANDETPESEVRRILGSGRNEDTYVWITPNCDGVIYQMIDKPFSER